MSCASHVCRQIHADFDVLAGYSPRLSDCIVRIWRAIMISILMLVFACKYVVSQMRYSLLGTSGLLSSRSLAGIDGDVRLCPDSSSLILNGRSSYELLEGPAPGRAAGST